MTILNRENDGLYSILITLATLVAKEKGISREDLLKICIPNLQNSGRANGTLNRWTTIGLFTEENGKIRLAVELKKGESLDAFIDRLPSICRRLALTPDYGLPLWSGDGRLSEEGVGLTADLCRGLAWCLSQDIYTLPTTHTELESIITEQIKPGYFVFMNDTRWPGLRDWARFLGFATGDDSRFFWDPTAAIQSELAQILELDETIPAADFMMRLAERLPILDMGSYRIEVEKALRAEKWSPPPSGHLSTACSFAFKRLQRQGAIGLLNRSDAMSRLTLTRQGGREWESFTHVNLTRKLP